MLQKIVDLFRINEEDYEYDEEVGDEIGYPDPDPDNSLEPVDKLGDYRGDRKLPRKKAPGGIKVRGNVIGMPGLANGISEVVVIEPHSFEEMPQVIQALRERKSVVLNLNVMNPEEAQRAVDFVAGGTYAMEGHQERVGESIFLFTPSCVKVSTLSGIIRDVDEIPEGRVRQLIEKTDDPWSDAAVMAQ